MISECDFTQCSTIEVLISQSRKVLLLNTYQIKLGQTCWKRTKGLGEKKKPGKTAIFYFSMKLLKGISSLKISNRALCQSTAQPGGFSGSPSATLLLLGNLWLRWQWCPVGRDGMPGRQRSHRGSCCSQPDARLQARNQSSNMTAFLLYTAPLSCF